MTLRARLTVTTLALVVPLVIAAAVTHGVTFALAAAAIHSATIVVALAAMLIGVGPIVRRAHELTLAVRKWQDDGAEMLPQDGARDEIGELARAFRGAAQAVAARKRELREFVENISHDLATPLTVLQGHLSSLAHGHDPRAVREAMNEAQYISQLLGSLGVIAKFESGAMVDGTIELGELTSRVAERHRAHAARLDLSLEYAVPRVPVYARGDVTFAEQALANLLGNALHHNQPAGHAVVVLDVDEGQFSLRVLDDGPGLTAEERTRVLQRGERGDGARSRDPNGRGLGLSIVTRVAAVHGWTFSLADNEPRGLIAELRGVTQPAPEVVGRTQPDAVVRISSDLAG